MSHRYEKSRGFTLIELMVGLTLGLMMMAALVTLFTNTSRSQGELEKSNRMIENGRYALDLLRQDIQAAGFYDLFYPDSNSSLTRADPCTAGAVGFSTAGGVSVPMPVFGYDNWVHDVEPAMCHGSSAASVYYRPGTDVLVVRYADNGTAVTPASISGTNVQYLQVSACAKDSSGTPFVVDTGAAAGNFVLRAKDCATARNVRPLTSRVFFVANCHVCTGANTDTIPTLKMLDMQGNSMIEVSLVEGIEDMQIEYALDRKDSSGSFANPDGIVDTWGVKAAAITDNCSTGYCWQNVMEVTVHLLARNTEATAGNSDDRSYLMGSDPVADLKTVATADKVFKRHAFVETIRVNNASIRRAQP